MGTVTYDGAYDTHRCHNAIIARDAIPLLWIRKNGRPLNENAPTARARTDALRATRHYGSAFWKCCPGYHALHIAKI